MILYRLAAVDDMGTLHPPRNTWHHRNSIASTSDQSIFSLSSDSKYPSGVFAHSRGLVPYAYDPDTDNVPEEDDHLHEPDLKDKNEGVGFWSSRGWLNIGALVLLIVALLSLFICYPVVSYYQQNARNQQLVNENANLNDAAENLAHPARTFPMPNMIDNDTPQDAKTRTGWDGEDYVLVFSDEFNKDGRSFYPGDDPYWEAVDLSYWATKDLEWYDPAQVTTGNGALRIKLENKETHGLPYKSGMLQSWNKLCFSSGYLEVSVTFPGPNSNAQGYWPGVWTMGNLGRPGYGATTDGLWPYSYDTCDVGTFPNQTLPDHSGPPAALRTDMGRATYNYELSWLPGQRLSSCTCPGEDHPGPTPDKGRGAPEIDVFEGERNKTGAPGGIVSQSAQFAPFTHDYLFDNSTSDKYTIFNNSITVPNSYRGSAVQQSVSALTNVPDNMFEGSGQVFTKFGFEYWAEPTSPENGFITWVANGNPSHRVAADAVGPDQGPGGTGVGRRLIPEEPMALVLNLGISPGWQAIDLSTLSFPTEMLIDYVRIYQRKGHENVGCSPDNYPTEEYIDNHREAYKNPNLTMWRGGVPGGAGYSWPRNELYSGSC